jgi:C-terminal processing protease CtpA/Prc
VPLYLLVSRGTGSAGEEFSFVLKNLGRAVLVGDRTAGAGHMVGMFSLPAGFAAGVSITRVSDPKTGREWEGIGVQPGLRVAPERALAVAQAAALRGLAAQAADAAARARYEMLVEWVEARDAIASGRTRPPDPARLAALAGPYEGERNVGFEGGRLVFRRAHGMPEELVSRWAARPG